MYIVKLWMSGNILAATTKCETLAQALAAMRMGRQFGYTATKHKV